MDYKKENVALAERAVALLKKANLTVATAESCTGGMLSAYITAVSGASDIFELGVASYSAKTKQNILKVNPQTIKDFGTISQETAKEMAEGIRDLASSDIGLSVTGVAGPHRSEEKDVGTVYIAISTKHKTQVILLNIKEHTREEIRQCATFNLLNLLIENIERGNF